MTSVIPKLTCDTWRSATNESNKASSVDDATTRFLRFVLVLLLELFNSVFTPPPDTFEVYVHSEIPIYNLLSNRKNAGFHY